MNRAEKWVNDYDDILFDWCYQEKKFMAIVRPVESRSLALVRHINTFFECQGFDALVERAKNGENWMSQDNLQNYMNAMGNISGLLSRQFCMEFLEELCGAVEAYLLTCPEKIIRKLDKEIVEQIINALDLLLKRYLSMGEKWEIIEKLYLKVALMLFNSNFVNQQIQGLKMLNEIATSLYATTSSPQSLDQPAVYGPVEQPS